MPPPYDLPKTMSLRRTMPVARLLDPKRNDATMLEVRSRMGALQAEGGAAAPTDLNYNDPLIQEIRQRGAPRGSTGTRSEIPVFGGGGEPVPELPPMARRPVVPRSEIPVFGGGGQAQAVPGSRVGFSPMNRGVQPGFGTGGPLSSRGARPMGRSMAEAPERRLETAARYGDVRAARTLAEMKQAGEERKFRQQQDALNFGRSQAQNEVQQQRQDQRFEQERADRFGMFGMEQAAREKQNADLFQKELTVFGMKQGAEEMKAERERQQAEADRKRMPQIGTMPVPGTDYVIPTADGRALGTLPLPRPAAKPPEGMVPQSATVDGVQYGPAEGKQEVPKIQMMRQPDGSSTPYSVHVDGKTGEVTMRKIKIMDENGDGIDDRTQGGGGATRPAGQGGWKSLLP